MRLDLGLGDKLGLAWKLRSLPRECPPREGRRAADVSGGAHSRDRDRQAISYHYDVANDFYALWLDRRMVYSCGYFGDPAQDIHRAQERRLDYVCRKLRLEQRHGEPLEHVDEVTYRIWRLFMSGSAYGFETDRLNLYQALLVKPGRAGESGLPLTRADLYDERE